MRFSVKYVPTTLFSLKDSNSTNSGGKALFLPSPYCIKMAILNQAINGGDMERLIVKESMEFSFIRDAKIGFYIPKGSNFCVNNSFVKILKPAREGGGFQQTVAFREYLYLSNPLEILFDVNSKEQKEYLQTYLHRINYFGKRGCFFQFVEYNDNPNQANVAEFNIEEMVPGILQEYDDFDRNTTFENADIFSTASAKRVKKIMTLPIRKVNTSKAYSIYKSV